MKHKIRCNGRKYTWSCKKFLLNLFILVMLISSFILIANSVKAETNHSLRTIVVHRGDTLWSISQQIDPNCDPRITIYKLKFHNSLNKVDLVVGQKLAYFVQN